MKPIEITATDRVFVLTGAGISAESGIATFRDAGGLWESHRFEDVASPEGFARDPQMVWRFYSQRRAQMRACQPNPAHRALAEMQAILGDRLFICTQNVDDLHERGGSREVHHMHGEIGKTRCESCDRAPFVDDGLFLETIPRCDCGAQRRPHIVWFGEIPFGMERIAKEIARATVFVTIGSSGAVYPAAGFVRQAKMQAHARTVYVGPEAPDNGKLFDEIRLGTAVEIVPTLLRTV